MAFCLYLESNQCVCVGFTLKRIFNRLQLQPYCILIHKTYSTRRSSTCTVGLIIKKNFLSFFDYDSMHCISSLKLVFKTVSLYQTIWNRNFLRISHRTIYTYLCLHYACVDVLLASCLGASQKCFALLKHALIYDRTTLNNMNLQSLGKHRCKLYK